MKPNVLFAVRRQWYDKIFSRRDLARLENIAEIIKAPIPEMPNKQFMLDHIGRAEIVVTSWDTPSLDRKIIDQAQRLELVVHAGGSVKPIVSDALWESGVRVTSAAAAIAYGVAEYCLGLILTAPKRVFWAAQATREGKWQEGMQVFHGPQEIYQQKIGIVGASHVGRHLMRLLKNFTCDLLLYDPFCSVKEATRLGAEKVESLEELFSQSMVVSLNAPETEATRGMITGKLLAKLPEGALFINSARGSLVREQEMVEELERGRIVACIDVTDPEPPAADSPLRWLPNVILTPHEAGVVNQNTQRVGTFAVDNIVAKIRGEPLSYEVKRSHLGTIG